MNTSGTATRVPTSVLGLLAERARCHHFSVRRPRHQPPLSRRPVPYGVRQLLTRPTGEVRATAPGQHAGAAGRTSTPQKSLRNRPARTSTDLGQPQQRLTPRGICELPAASQRRHKGDWWCTSRRRRCARTGPVRRIGSPQPIPADAPETHPAVFHCTDPRETRELRRKRLERPRASSLSRWVDLPR